MSRILIDITRLMYRRVTGVLPTGIDRVSREYVRRYGVAARAVVSLGPFSVVLSERDSLAAFRAAADDSVPARVLAAKLVAKAVLWRWLALGVRGDTLINTGHTGLENPRYGWWLRRRGARVVVVVHDLIPITHPQFCRPREPRLHRVRMRAAASVSSAVVANSEHTLAEFRAFCDSAALPLPRCAVARLGCGLGSSPSACAPIAGPYFVMLGTIEPRKNHAMVLGIWRRMTRLGSDAPKLVVIGQRGWHCDDIVAQLEGDPVLKGLVVYRPRCGDEELAGWLQHARALLCPSFAEGFGLPLVEALSAGVPAIASDLPVLREVAGDVPEYARPDDAQRWERLIGDYARPGSELRAAQLARMKSFRASTWAQHFAVVDDLLAHA